MLRFDPLSLSPSTNPMLTMTMIMEEEKEEEAANWLDLPDHVTLQIVSKLPSISDYMSFSAVCVSWQSLFNSDDFPKLLSLHPLLMVPTPTTIKLIDNANENKKKKKNKNKKKKEKRKAKKTFSCSFYSISERRVYNQFQFRMPLNRYCRGSSKGWLVTVDDDHDGISSSVQLFNPFTGKEISLPSLRAFPYNDGYTIYSYMCLRKAVLSADPISNPKGYLVMAIYDAMLKLAVFKSGDKAWTPIKYENECGVDMIDDVIYYKGRIHAINYEGKVMVCDETNVKVIRIIGPPSNDHEYLLTWKKYLVESSGDLFQVHRCVPMDDDQLYTTEGFKVFKLLLPAAEHEGGEFEWVEVKNLDGRALFLGDNGSISISASGFPGCKPNSIYYTDDYIEGYYFQLAYGPHDIGVYDLESETYEIHYPTDIKTSIWPAPIWIEKTMIQFGQKK